MKKHLLSYPLTAVASLILSLSSWAGTPQVAAGGTTSFAIDSQGNLFGWGNNDYSVLGLGEVSSINVPTLALGGIPYKKVVPGRDFAIGIRTDGTLWAWGNNPQGQLGNGSTISSRIPLNIGKDFDDVAIFGEMAGTLTFVFAIKNDGSLWKWGAGSNKPVQIAIGSKFKFISPPFAIKTDGTLLKFENGDVEPIQLGTDYSSISYNGAYAIKTNGLLVNFSTGTTMPNEIGSGYKAVSSSGGFTMALKTDGTLWTWGDNTLGALGNGSYSYKEEKIPQKIGSDFVDIAAGNGNAFAVKKDGSLWAWGSERGYLGSNGIGDIVCGFSYPQGVLSEDYCNPIPIKIGDGFSKVITSPGDMLVIGNVFNVAIKNNGTVWSWGDNSYGQLGLDNSSRTIIPNKIGVGYKKISNVFGITSESRHTTAIKLDGTLWSWGGNWAGALGDGTQINRSSPVKIGEGYIDVTAGSGFTVALKADKTIWSWGDNQLGELGVEGVNDLTSQSTLDHQLVGQGYESIAATSSRVMAIKTDGSLWAWGSGRFGELGDGTKINRVSHPIQIGTNFVYVYPSDHSTVAIKKDGSLWTWGDNSFGQLGDGTKTGVYSPKQIGTGFISAVTGSAHPSAVTGSAHTIALKADGSLWAWGDNSYGQYGDGTTVSSLVPKQVGTGFSTAPGSIAAGDGYTLAVRKDGTVWVAGKNQYGQLGNNSLATSFTMVSTLDPTGSTVFDLAPEVANAKESERLPLYFTEADKKTSTSLNAILTDARAKGITDGSVYFTALVPKGSPLSPSQNSFTATTGGTENLCLDGGRRGVKQDSQTPCKPVNQATTLGTGNSFAAYTDASADPLKGSNAIVCTAITTTSLSAKGQALVRSVATGDTPTGVAQCPPVQTEATTRLYRAQSASGSNGGLMLDVMITPQAEDRGQSRSIYSWAIAPDGRQFMQSKTQGWVSMTDSMDSWMDIPVPTTGDITLPILRGENISQLSGALLYIGLGSSWEEVKSWNKAGHYYTVE